MRYQGFIGPSYTLQSVNVDCQRCVNLYPEADETGRGKAQEVAALVSTPGLSRLATIGSGPIRGCYAASNGTLFVVSANKLYSVSSSWAATELGTLQTSAGPVSMADNGLQLVTVDGNYGYVWTLASSSFAQITDEAFPGADQVTYQDGYFIFNDPDTGKFFISGLNDVTFDALDIASSEGNPDNVVGVLSVHRDLWLFNQNTIEVFYDSGNSDFPFERTEGAFIEHGCAAAFSIAKLANTIFWVAQDDSGAGIVFMATGFQPQRISTHAIEKAISEYGDISTARAYTYQERGHFFYVINFPNADTTWVYDTATSLWHERTYSNSGVQERHRADCHAFAYSKHVVGDYSNGNLYELSSSVYSDDSAPITRMRTSPHIIIDDLNKVFYHKFQLDLETGTGLDGSGQGTDPQAILQFSDDGGHSWSNEKWASLGKIGERFTRAIWRRLGSARDRVFKVTITDPIKVTLIGAELELEPGAA